MSTKMTERDWELALEVFRACLPRRGAKGRDDRLFLEALHYFAVHDVTWRALPERFGPWNSVWKPALFIEIGGNGWRARESSVESSCYTEPDSSARSTPWVKRYSRSPRGSTSPFASRAGQSG